MSKFADLDDCASRNEPSAKDSTTYPAEWRPLLFDVMPDFENISADWIEEAKQAPAVFEAKSVKEYKYRVIMRAYGPAIPIFGVLRQWVVDIEIRQFPVTLFPVILVKEYFDGREKINDKMPKSMWEYKHDQYPIIQEAIQQAIEWGKEWNTKYEFPFRKTSVGSYQKAKTATLQAKAQHVEAVAAVSHPSSNPFKKNLQAASKHPTLAAEKKAISALSTSRYFPESIAEETSEQLAEVTYEEDYGRGLPTKRPRKEFDE